MCPVCSKLHPLANPDVTLLPINYAVQDIILASSNEPTVDKEHCAVCLVKPAFMICIDCEPGKHYKFCKQCDLEEHSRSFGPVQKHRRFAIDDVAAPILSYSMTCARHNAPATLYSERSDEFACSNCTRDTDWDARSPFFEHYASAAKKLRNKVQRMTKYTNESTKRLMEARKTMETIMNELEPGSMAVKANITRTFSKCIEMLQERQRVLLANVDDEVSYCFVEPVVFGCFWLLFPSR